MIKVLFDGWPLARQPESPPTLHLYDLLARLPEDVQAYVAVPARLDYSLPGDPEILLLPAIDQPASRLAWEQRSLTRLFKRVNADILHVTSGHAPLFGPAKILFSPVAIGERILERSEGLAGRLRSALVEGSRARGAALLWPESVPLSPDQEENPRALYRAPVSVPQEFFFENAGGSLPEDDLPEQYVLYHGPSTQPDLARLLEIWRWVAGSVGDDFALLLVGMQDFELDLLPGLLDGLTSVRALPPLSPGGLARVYRSSTAVLHPALLGPWCGALQLGLACGRPVVALETEVSGTLAGPAAYLVPESTSDQQRPRAFSAALLTVLVEEDVAAQLSQAASRQAAAWESDRFSQRLGEIYRALALH